jgi:hypothetical protein
VYLLLSLLAACSGTTPPGATIKEASGVIRHGDQLYVADDSANGAYFRVPLREGCGPIIPLNDFDPVRVDLPRVGIWVDIEGIDCLADGRIALLSERLRSLVGEEGLIAEYDYPLTEIGRRGLEGLAVRHLADGSSRIAVLWEGGYPDPGSLHPQLETRIGGIPLRPFIFVHDLKPGATVGRVRWHAAVHTFELEVPRPPGDEPEAQRFRSPDLVWYHWPDERPDPWGFIVLLSSQNAVAEPQFLHHWLQRFNVEGQPVGPPLDIADFVPPELGNANWEGLGWFDSGERLVLVHEGTGDVQPNAIILSLPFDWKHPM